MPYRFLLILVAFLLGINASCAAALFDTYAIFPVGARAEALAIGDLNNNGRNDLAIVTSEKLGDPENSNKLHVFIQSSTGTLVHSVKYATGRNPLSVAIGDINNDSKADVVVASYSDSSIDVFLQNDSGTLDTPVIYSCLPLVGSVKIADLNNDGKNDLAVSYWDGDSISVFLQTDGGTLGQPVHYNVESSGENEIGIADLNADGREDIVLMGKEKGIKTFAVFLQNETATFNSPIYYSLTGSDTQAHGIACGNTNNDTRIDVVITYGGNTGYVGIFLQNETGALDSPTSLTAYDSPGPIEIADLNGNGRDDLAIVHYGKGIVSVYKQGILGGYTGYQTYKIPAADDYRPQAMAIADLNGNGLPDIAIADPDNGLIVLYHALNRLKFTTPSRKSTPGQPTDIIQIEAQNADGERLPGFNETITLSSSSSTGKFSLNKINWVDTTVLALNNGQGSFYYQDSSIGDFILYVQRSAMLGDSQKVSITVLTTIVPCNNIINPLRGEKTTIMYDLGSTCKVTIKIYNIIGEEIRTLVNEVEKPAGLNYQLEWDGKNDARDIVASGIYLLYLKAGVHMITEKIAVVK